ncbi:hypothetical protein S40293_01733 [Stachybotrys chartarum IBT 40293]|nr:hypothetical protein S40293_01733 [Stachybotrys chartarum IBT 40293]
MDQDNGADESTIIPASDSADEFILGSDDCSTTVDECSAISESDIEDSIHVFHENTATIHRIHAGQQEYRDRNHRPGFEEWLHASAVQHATASDTAAPTPTHIHDSSCGHHDKTELNHAGFNATKPFQNTRKPLDTLGIDALVHTNGSDEDDEDDVDDLEHPCFDPLDVEDDFIPAEDGIDEDDVEENDPNTDTSIGEFIPSKRKSNELNQASKKHRIGSQSAEDWIKEFDQTHFVAEDDEYLNAFRHRMRLVLRRLKEWAIPKGSDEIKDWIMKGRENKEMTNQFRSVLIKYDPDKLADELFCHMPRKSQQIFGMTNLRPIDLLDLPQVPLMFRNRMTYLNIAVQVEEGNIFQGPSSVHPKSSTKCIKDFASLSDSAEVKVYIGSTIARSPWERLQTHEREATKMQGFQSLHYATIRRPGVVSNFRLGGVWTNPAFVAGEKPVEQDIARWFPVLLEGLLMVYLGTFNRGNYLSSNGRETAPEPSVALVEWVRSAIDLPDLSRNSLNRSWPL